jgi:hypothetical protein
MLSVAAGLADARAAAASLCDSRGGQPASRASQGQRTMQITLRAAAVTPLGKPLPLDITLSNPGHSPLVIDDPAQSMDIEMHLVYKPTGEDFSFTMGKITTTQIGSADEYAIEVPPPKPTSMAPGGSLAIKPDANSRLFLRPGDYDVFVTHKASESNHLPLKVELTRESVGLLFATARDPQMPYSRREWASDWLAKLDPGFRPSLALPDEPLTRRAQREAGNLPLYQRFAEWWREQQASAQLDERLGKLR